MNKYCFDNDQLANISYKFPYNTIEQTKYCRVVGWE